MTPAEQIRHDIELEIFGPNVLRIPYAAGSVHAVPSVERGSGSAFQRLPADKRTRIEIADTLIEAEAAEAAARIAGGEAVAKYEAAVARTAGLKRQLGIVEQAEQPPVTGGRTLN